MARLENWYIKCAHVKAQVGNALSYIQYCFSTCENDFQSFIELPENKVTYFQFYISFMY